MNYKTIFLETTVACVITGFYIYKFVRYRKSLKQYKNKNKNIKVERFSKTPIILLLVFMLLCLASLYYGCRTSNQSIVEAVIFLICIVAIEIIMIDKKYCLHHTDDTFLQMIEKLVLKRSKLRMKTNG